MFILFKPRFYKRLSVSVLSHHVRDIGVSNSRILNPLLKQLILH